MIEKNSFLNKIFRQVKKNMFYFLNFRKFKKLSYQSTIVSPDCIDGAKNISIGKSVYINNRSWIKAFKFATVNIKDNVYIGRNLHLIAMSNILISENVLIADNVYISDNIHEYKDVSLPIRNQGVIFKGAVEISNSAWLGENSCIIGCKIGKHSIVSANSVVLSDVPDYSIVAGSPAKIIKYYDENKKEWLKYNEVNITS